MYPIGEDFKNTLKNSHKIAVKVEVLDGGIPVRELDINEGNVSVDRHKNVRRSCSIQVVDKTGELTPSAATDLLTPYGNELKLYRGVQIRNNIRSYQGEVLRDKPNGYWRFEERAFVVTVKDSSVWNNPGTVYGNPVFGQRGAIIDQFADAGGFTSSITFATRNGNNRIVMNNVPGTGANGVTMECWALKSEAGGVWATPMSCRGQGNNLTFYYEQDTDKLQLWLRNSTDSSWLYISGPIAKTNTWYHLIGTVSPSGEAKFYVDGKLWGTTTGLGARWANTWAVGSHPDGSWPFIGSVDEPAVYGGVMSQEQVTRHFEVGRALRPEYRDEYVPLGVFGIEEVTISDGGDNFTIQVEGMDRAMRVERARFVNNYIVPEGTNYATAIRDMINSVVPGLQYNFMTTSMTTPKMVFGGSGGTGGGSAWENGQKMARAIGAELYFDVNGVCVLAPIPNYNTAPVVWDYREGPESLLLYVSKGLAREGVFNHVVASGESSSNTEPVRAEAEDLDQNSPTYVLGKFGRVPMFHRSEKIKTTAQAQAVADGLLRLHSGLNAQVYFISLVNPAHDAGDVITIIRQRTKVTGRYVLEKFNIPLTAAGSMNATVKERRI